MKFRTVPAILILAVTLAIYTGGFLAAESEIIKLDAVASFYGDEFQGRPTSSGEIFDMNAFTAAHKTLPFGTILEVTNLENGKKTVVRVNDRGPFVDTRDLDISKAAAFELGMVTTGTARVSLRRLTGADAEAFALKTAPGQATGNLSAATTATASPEAKSAPGTMSVTVTSTVSKTTMAAPETATPAAATAAATATETDPAAGSPTGVIAGNTKVSPAPVQNATPPAHEKTATVAYWRIQLGAFSREENATRLVVRLRKDGFNPAFEKTDSMIRVVLSGISEAELPGMRNKLGKAGYSGFIVRQEAR